MQLAIGWSILQVVRVPIGVLVAETWFPLGSSGKDGRFRHATHGKDPGASGRAGEAPVCHVAPGQVIGPRSP